MKRFVVMKMLIILDLIRHIVGAKPYKSANEIYSDLAESRTCYERNEYEDFDNALDDISMQISNVDKAIQVASTLAIDNVYLNNEAKENLIAIANKEKTVEDYIADLNKKYDR